MNSAIEEMISEILSKEVVEANKHLASTQQIISLIDLTCLNHSVTWDEIIELCKKAEQTKVAAICILPEHLKWIPNDFSLSCATVVNFPSGKESLDKVTKSIRNITNQNIAKEIDYVFPYALYKKDERGALAHCHHCYTLCHQHGLVFKVILETSAFSSPESVYIAATEIINSGCDFLKTSTGTTTKGATLPEFAAMLLAIRHSDKPCGIKASGGVKTQAQASQFVRLGESVLGQPATASWFRIGASSLLSELETSS